MTDPTPHPEPAASSVPYWRAAPSGVSLPTRKEPSA